MLDIQIKIEGDKVIIEGLNKIAAEMPGAINRGLQRVAVGIDRAAFDWLLGPGAKGKTEGAVYSDIKTRKLKLKGQKWTPQNIAAGGYPVPGRTGHLKRSLDWLHPGATKSVTRHGEKHDVGSITAGPNEAIIYNAAEYANVIHEGRGSSAKFGPRRYLTDALERFNQGARIKKIMEEEIQKEIDKRFK